MSAILKLLLVALALAATTTIVTVGYAAESTSAGAARYRTVKVDGLSIFYREAGRPDAPTLLLLHGFPSSSRMYEPLMSRLSGEYHLISPDFPGFGYSDAPPSTTFAYTF